MAFVRAPAGRAYQALLRALRPLSRGIFLFVHHEEGLEERGQRLLERLEGHRVESFRVGDWPGTSSDTVCVTAHRFLAHESVVETILQEAGHLYAWLHPGLPEDLCFVREDDSPLLWSVAHERMGGLELTEGEFASVANLVPAFSAIVRGVCGRPGHWDVRSEHRAKRLELSGSTSQRWITLNRSWWGLDLS